MHRDVKPANVLINGDHAYLSDFGITRVQASDTRITDSGNWIGTVDFMAPEHLRGEPTDARADVYALGCVLFTALTGTPPFRRETVPVTITAHLHDPPPRPSETTGVPAAFDAVIARALAKAPEDRYPSAGDLGRAARAAAAGEWVSTARGSVATGAATPEEAEPTRVAPAPGATAVMVDLSGMVPDKSTGAAAAFPGETAATAHAGASPPPPPPRDQRRPAAVKVQRGRGRKLALAATVAVLAIPTVLVVRWVAGADGTPTGPLTAAEVRDAAQSFADAYSNEDDAALRRTLTPAVRRWGANGAAQRGRPAVVGEYHRQFATSKVKDYALDGLKVSGGPAGRAEGRYTVTRDGAPPITGRIVFGVVRRDGKPAIDLIATEPRA